MEQQKTINYFQFKHIDSNRPIDQNHVKRLVAAIQKKDLLHLHPIVVNQKMEIIDGQHRLKAAEQLRIYVHYVVDDNINKSDIATINSNAKNWTVLDYINYFATENAPGFDKLTEFMIANPKIQVSSVIFLLSASDNNLNKNLRNGVLNIGSVEMANTVASALVEYSEEFLFKHTY